MAILLGKSVKESDRYDSLAKVAFSRSLDYLPSSNCFIYRCNSFLGNDTSIALNDSGIDGSCVNGCGVKTYSFKMPSADGELFIYRNGDKYWYITIKCRGVSGDYNYMEFVFEDVSPTPRRGKRIYPF